MEQRWPKYRPRQRHQKKCLGCGHAPHGRYCMPAAGTFGQHRAWCSCQFERPRTRRQRHRYWARVLGLRGSAPRRTVYSDLAYGQQLEQERRLDERKHRFQHRFTEDS